MVICFTKYLLDQKSRLSKIWLAAHYEKKLKRTQIFEINIQETIQHIMDAEIILDLRISGHLLVGIVKIHSKKTKYLLSECNTIFYQVKIFHGGRIDLPDNKQTAALNDITLTEYLNDNFDKDANENVDAIFSCNQSRMEDITLKEATTEKLTLWDDDMMNFDFHEEDEPFEFPGENLLSVCNEFEAPKDVAAEQPRDATAEQPGDTNTEQPRNATVVFNLTVAVYSVTSPINLKTVNENLEGEGAERTDEMEVDFENIDPEDQINENPDNIDSSRLMNGDIDEAFSGNFDIPNDHNNNTRSDDLELEPLNVSPRRYLKEKSRKRKLCIDYVKCFSKEDINKQIMDGSSILTISDLAPDSKRLMELKEIGSAEKLLRLPFLKLQNKKLLKVYERNLNSRPCDDFDSSSEEDGIAPEPQTRRNRSRGEPLERPAVNENMSHNLEDSPTLNIETNTDFNPDIDFPVFTNNFMDNEGTDGLIENQDYGTLFPENLPSSQLQMDGKNDFQSTPMSKTSQERWEYALQGRIIHTLGLLKQLFESQSEVRFSSIAKNNRRLWVAQIFLCLLMLKKLEIISLDQSCSYGEILIYPGLQFEAACSKFCNV